MFSDSHRSDVYNRHTEVTIVSPYNGVTAFRYLHAAGVATLLS